DPRARRQRRRPARRQPGMVAAVGPRPRRALDRDRPGQPALPARPAAACAAAHPPCGTILRHRPARHRAGQRLRGPGRSDMPMSRHPFAIALLALFAACAWLAPRPAQAVTCSARIDNFSFGAGIDSAGRDTSTQLHWQCSRGSTPPSQALDIRICLFITQGGSPPGINPRWLRRDSAPNTLVKFDIFGDPALTQVVGDEASNLPFGLVATLAANQYFNSGSVPIYGRIYPNQAMLPYQHTA